MVLGRNVPVRILHRAEHVQAPGRALLEIWRAAAHAELRATRDRFRAVLFLAVERAHLPIVPSRTRLDDFELRIEREGHPRVLEGDVSIGLRVVHFGHDLVDPGGREGGIVLDHVSPVGIGPDGVVLVEAADDEHSVVWQRSRRRVPARVLLVGWVRRLGTLLVARIAVVVERRIRVAREQSAAEGVVRPVPAGARLAALHPRFALRVEDVDLVQPVVALHVMAAEHVHPPIGQRHARIAVGVIEHAALVADLLERRPVHGEVCLVEQRRVQLAAVLERVGVAKVEQQLPFHRAVRGDARRYALAQPLPHPIAAVGESLK